VGDKVLLFSQSIPTLNYIENIFKRQRVVYQRLDGSTPMNGRQDSIRKFNADAATQVYLISTKAGGVGLNIHGANRVIIFDFKYTPTDEQQAIGRAYRLGQSKPVYVYWLTIGGTFEDTIHNNAVFKTQLASRVVDKKNPDPWSRKFAEWFKMPKMPDQEDLSSALGQDQVLDALLNSEDIGKLIRKITSTETFEKEEKDELTPEEKREAEEEVELERLRIQNPEEFRRRELERIRQPFMAVPQLPSPPNPNQPPGCSIDGESQAAPLFRDNRIKSIIKITVPEHLRDKRTPGRPVPHVVPGGKPSPSTPLPSQ
jgi:superfamily II DNA/RNA helicase